MAFSDKINRAKRDPSREQLRNLRHGLTLAPVVVTPRQEGAFPNRVPRQIARARARYDAASEARGERGQDRHAAQYERLDRQAKREKNGFYEGTMALANILGERFGRMRRQRGDKGGLVRLG